MGKRKYADRQGQAGFTLVELAVVMIIIGLLIGGVLKGQELITNAQITASVSQMKGIDAAITTFRDTYAALPGDMVNAGGVNGRLPNCGACDNGDGNNRIATAGASTAGTVPANETLEVWRHLNAADLLTGVDGSTGALAFGTNVPAASIGGGYFIGFHPGGTTLPGQVTGASPRGGHYLSLTGTPNAAVGANTAVLRASQAARIDRKMDDGAPGTGTVIAAGDGTCIIAGGGGVQVYNEQTDPLACALHVRIQQ